MVFNNSSEENFDTFEMLALCEYSPLWRNFNVVKLELFQCIKEGFEKNEKGDERDYTKESIAEDRRVYNLLLEKWKVIERYYKNCKSILPRLEGALFEALYYYCALKGYVLFRQIKWFQEGGAMRKDLGELPKIEIIPIFEAIPRLFMVPIQDKEKPKLKRVAPQVNADFLLLNPEGREPSEPYLIDVKSSMPNLKDKDQREKLDWQLIGAHYYGAYLKIAYPKEGIGYPFSMKDWNEKFLWKFNGDIKLCDLEEIKRS